MIRFIEEEDERLKFKQGELSNLNSLIFVVRTPMKNLETNLLKVARFKK
jgi:hypothetical protein